MKDTSRSVQQEAPGTPLLELRVTGICASPRKGGNSDILMGQILAGAEERGVPGEGIHLCDYRFEPCIGCERCRKDEICTGLDDGMQSLYPKILGSRGLVEPPGGAGTEGRHRDNLRAGDEEGHGFYP